MTFKQRVRSTLSILIVVASSMTLASCVSALGAMMAASDTQSPGIWLRAEAYSTAVDVALAQSDLSRGDPSLVGRDFTHQGLFPGTIGLDWTYTSCAIEPSTIADHTGLSGPNCTAFPGMGGIKHDGACPEVSCVIVSVRTETWADPISRQIIINTMNDHSKVCEYAASYGPNKRADVLAAECKSKVYKPIKLAVEVKPRLLHPCVNRPVGDKGYTPICSNPKAVLYFVN